MELKKSPKADLERKKGLFLEVGLALVVGVALMAFEWGTQEMKTSSLYAGVSIVVDEDIINTQQEEKKPELPPPPAVPSDVLAIVDNDVLDLKTDLSLFEEDLNAPTPVVLYPQGEEEALEEDIPYLALEEQADFRYKGRTGLNAFRAWIADNMKYPAESVANGVQGRVTMQFTVGTDGRVVNVKVLSGKDPALDKEAVRVIEASPKWTPGKQRNQPVRALYTLPVIFQLQ